MHINYIEWRAHPFRSDRFIAIWQPALDRALAFGASAAYITRNIEDPLHFRQVTMWERKEDFERFWASDEVTAMREEALNYFNKPVLPIWHSMVADAAEAEAAEASAVETAS